MADSAEYLRTINTVLSEVSERQLINLDFTTGHPFAEQGNATTRSLSIVQVQDAGAQIGCSFTGDGALKFDGQDATGAGNERRVQAHLYTQRKDWTKTRLEFFCRWVTEEALADWYRMEFLVYVADGANSHRAGIRFFSNLNVDNAYQYYADGPTWTAVTAATIAPRNPRQYTGYNTFKFSFDIATGLYIRGEIGGQEMTNIGGSAYDQQADTTSSDVYVWATWYIDADNTAHEAYLDEISLKELD